MPDDEVIEEESLEQEDLDQEEVDEFDSITDESLEPKDEILEPDKPEEKPEEKPDPDKEEKEEEDPDKKEDPEKKEDDPDPDKKEELSIEDGIKARAEEIRKESGEPEPDKPEPDKKPDTPGPDPDPVVDEGGPLTKEDVKYLLDFVDDSELPGEMTIGDDDLNLKEYAEQYPEETQVAKVISGVVANKMLGNLLDSGAVVTRQDYEQAEKHIQNMGHVVNQVLYFMNVMGTHSDVLQLNSSKDFTGWLEKQSNDVKALNTTGDFKDAIKVLDYYKETIAKAETKPIDEKAKAKKDKKDALHKGTVRAKPAIKGGGEDEEDESAIFDSIPD